MQLLPPGIGPLGEPVLRNPVSPNDSRSLMKARFDLVFLLLLKGFCLR